MRPTTRTNTRWYRRRIICRIRIPAQRLTLIGGPPARSVYITDDQYLGIRDALLLGMDGKPTPTGAMVQCYMDLLFRRKAGEGSAGW